MLQESKTTLYVIYETIISDTKYLINNHDFFINNIVPKLS